MFGLHHHIIPGSKSISPSFGERMKCGWGRKHGGNTNICRWFMGMCWANKEREVQNDTDSSQGKLGPGRMTVIVQITTKQSEITINLHPLWRQVGIQSAKNTLPSSSFRWRDFFGVGKQYMVFFAVFFKSILFVWILVTHKYATYSLMRFSLISAIVLLKALNPCGTPGDTPVTVPESANQCIDT